MVLDTIYKGNLNTPQSDQENTLHEDEIPVEEYRALLSEIGSAIELGGYNPISQILGFLLSEDPTHIANFGNARALIGKLDRDTLLEDMVRYYLAKTKNEDTKA